MRRVSDVAVLVSGGVDSSLALMRLARAAEHRLTACYLKIWLEDELAFLGRCPWQEDLEYVRAVCALAGVPLEIVSLQREYRERIVEYVVDALRAGATPSPDVLCNRRIKLGAFLERCGDSCDLVATGHYARTRVADGAVELLCGLDPVKDQTYFLSQLRQEQVARSLFPVGGLTKREVRREAAALGLPTHDRPDSQGICFLGRVPYGAFVEHHLGRRAGVIREVGSGRVLGRHPGYWFFTVGQRRGLGLAGGPWYVVAKDVAANEVHVAHRDRLADWRRDRFQVPVPHWIGAPPAGGRLEVRIRHGERRLPCRVSITAGGAVAIELDRPDAGVAPGQFAVLYDGEVCLGGGAIAGSPRCNPGRHAP